MICLEYCNWFNKIYYKNMIKKKYINIIHIYYMIFLLPVLIIMRPRSLASSHIAYILFNLSERNYW